MINQSILEFLGPSWLKICYQKLDSKYMNLNLFVYLEKRKRKKEIC